jgi:predicted dehydrogenase
LAFTHWEELLGAGGSLKLAGVTIALPVELHARVVCAFLKAGCAVLCEKPLAIKIADIEDIEEAACHGVLDVVRQLEYEPTTRLLVNALRSGQLGDLRTIAVKLEVRGQRAWHDVLVAFLPHYLHLARAFSGLLCVPRLQHRDDLECHIAWEHRNGVQASVHIVMSAVRSRLRVTLGTSIGPVCLHNGIIEEVPPQLHELAMSANARFTSGLRKTPIVGYFGPGLGAQYSWFAKVIREGQMVQFWPSAIAASHDLTKLLESFN